MVVLIDHATTTLQRNPNVVSGYYDSPEFQNLDQNIAGGREYDVRDSPYFGDKDLEDWCCSRSSIHRLFT